MSALYAMRYLGGTGVGVGAIFIGNGKIVGVDVANGRYHGTYTEQGGRIKGTATLSIPSGGTLVTGQSVPPGAKLHIAADWPSDLGNGQAHTVLVQGNPVQVTFEKIGEVP